MIGQIIPLVEGGRANRRLTALHVTGGIAGGLVAGAAIGLLGSAVQLFIVLVVPHEAAAGFFVAIALLVGLRDLGLTRRPTLSANRQTPKSWSCALGPNGACFAWGADLGLGFSTRVHAQLFWLLPTYLLLFGDVWSSVLAMGVFGASRAGIVAIVVRHSNGSDLDDVFDYINSQGERWRRSAGVAAVGFAGLIVYNLLG